jgi:hypothetical protein
MDKFSGVVGLSWRWSAGPHERLQQLPVGTSRVFCGDRVSDIDLEELGHRCDQKRSREPHRQ